MSSPTRPIGYVEVQRKIGTLPFPDAETAPRILREVWAEMARDRPDLVPYGSRIDDVVDGAGVTHCTWYIGFAPRIETTPPLDPRNLNDAPVPKIGDATPPDSTIGMKEQRF